MPAGIENAPTNRRTASSQKRASSGRLMTGGIVEGQYSGRGIALRAQ